jgi:hypothetical protein
VLGAGHRPADDLAIDQLDPLLGVREKVVDGLESTGFHPRFPPDR